MQENYVDRRYHYEGYYIDQDIGYEISIGFEYYV
jgi:hypothetical protein